MPVFRPKLLTKSYLLLDLPRVMNLCILSPLSFLSMILVDTYGSWFSQNEYINRLNRGDKIKALSGTAGSYWAATIMCCFCSSTTWGAICDLACWKIKLKTHALHCLPFLVSSFGLSWFCDLFNVWHCLLFSVWFGLQHVEFELSTCSFWDGGSKIFYFLKSGGSEKWLKHFRLEIMWE